MNGEKSSAEVSIELFTLQMTEYMRKIQVIIPHIDITCISYNITYQCECVVLHCTPRMILSYEVSIPQLRPEGVS